MRTAVTEPTPPLRDTVTPGVRARRSDTTTVWLDWISAVVRTVTDWPTRSADWAERLAVTTTSSSRLGSVTEVTVCALAALAASRSAAAAALTISSFLMGPIPRLTTSRRAERPRSDMETRPVATAQQCTAQQTSPFGKNPVSLGTPRPREGRPRRAGLLARGSMPVRTAFPGSPAFAFGTQWLLVRGLAAYSCVGSPGFTPEFPFHPHHWGTCRSAAIKPLREARQWSAARPPLSSSWRPGGGRGRAHRRRPAPAAEVRYRRMTSTPRASRIS